MGKAFIHTPNDFARVQEASMEAALCGEPSLYCPTNEDLIRVLERWDGRVCFDLETDAPSLMVELNKKELVFEIRRNWNLSAISNLKFSAINTTHKFLVLKVF